MESGFTPFSNVSSQSSQRSGLPKKIVYGFVIIWTIILIAMACFSFHLLMKKDQQHLEFITELRTTHSDEIEKLMVTINQKEKIIKDLQSKIEILELSSVDSEATKRLLREIDNFSQAI